MATEKDSADIAEIIGNYTFLEKKGSVYKGFCPFCNSSDERLVVRPDLNEWHCFQCGSGGTAEDFVDQYNTMVLHRGGNDTAPAPTLAAITAEPQEDEEEPTQLDDGSAFEHYFGRLQKFSGYQAATIFDGNQQIIAENSVITKGIDFTSLNQLFIGIVDKVSSLLGDGMTTTESQVVLESEDGVMIYSSMSFREEPVHVIVVGKEKDQQYLMKLQIAQLIKY